MTCDWQIKQADAGYKEFSSKIRSANIEKQAIHTKQYTVLREIANLHRAMDVIRSNAFEFEGIDGNEDDVIIKYTKEDSDDWYGVFNSAADEMVKTMICKCIKIANLAANYDVLTDRISVLNKEQNKYGDEIVAEFRSKESNN